MTMQTTTDDAKGKKGKAATKQAPAPTRKPKEPGRWTEAFSVKLSREEIAAKADRAAELDAELEALRADKTNAAKSFKGRIDSKESELRDTMRSIRTGTETRPVDVVEEFDYRTNTRILRADTRAIIRTRALTPDERQADLFDTAASAKKDGPQATLGEAITAKAERAKKNGHARKADAGPTDITAPQDILDAAAEDIVDAGTKRRPAKRRGR